ncbi:MAG: LuxR C-terminal-related transcriptional regulator [Rhodothalassiaceae bacterium]
MSQSASPAAVIADDHELVRTALAGLVAEAGLRIAGEAGDGLEAIRLVKSLRPHLLLLDIAMPGAKGIEVFTEARRWSPDTRVLVLTGLSSLGLLRQFVQSDVEGLVLKQQRLEAVRAALSCVLQGGTYRSPELSAKLDALAGRPALTKREMQVLSRIASGHTNKEIARLMGISEKTVDRHRTNLMAKLGVHSVAELMAYALREGLLDPTSHV